jgi:hypothetical protein
MLLVLLLTSPALAGDEDYKLGPDSMRQEGVPQGTVTKDVWHSKVFPETVRDYWVYVPKQYDGDEGGDEVASFPVGDEMNKNPKSPRRIMSALPSLPERGDQP